MSKLNKSFPRVPCKQDDLDFLSKKASQANISKAQFLRNAVYYTSVNEIDKESEKRKLYLLSRVSSNINQIAKYVNTKKNIDEKVLENLQIIRNSFINEVEKNDN